MTTVGKELIESADEALAIAQGRLQPAKVIAPEVINVAAIHKRLHLSQDKFAPASASPLPRSATGDKNAATQTASPQRC